MQKYQVRVYCDYEYFGRVIGPKTQLPFYRTIKRGKRKITKY